MKQATIAISILYADCISLNVLLYYIENSLVKFEINLYCSSPASAHDPGPHRQTDHLENLAKIVEVVDHEERAERDAGAIRRLRELCEDAVAGAHRLYGPKMGTSKVHRTRHFYEGEELYEAAPRGVRRRRGTTFLGTGDAVRFPGLLACSAWKPEALHKRSRAAFNKTWRALSVQDHSDGAEALVDRGARVMEKVTALNYLYFIVFLNAISHGLLIFLLFYVLLYSKIYCNGSSEYHIQHNPILTYCNTKYCSTKRKKKKKYWNATYILKCLINI